MKVSLTPFSSGNIPIWKRRARRFQRITRTLAAGLLAAIALAGCKEEYVSPEVHWKSDPGEKYSINVELDGSKLRNASVINARADYYVQNFQSCMKTDKWAAIGGAQEEPFRQTSIDARIIGDNKLYTTAYKNPLVDEDYFGLGACRWVLRGILINLMSPNGEFFVSVGDNEINPGSFKMFCSGYTHDCGVDRGFSTQSQKYKFTSGTAVISKE